MISRLLFGAMVFMVAAGLVLVEVERRWGGHVAGGDKGRPGKPKGNQ